MESIKKASLKRTPLKPGQALETKKPLAGPTKRISKRSKKTQKFYEEFRIPFVIQFLEEHPYCEIRWDENCQGEAIDVDEIKLRSRGGAKVPQDGDPSNFQSSCRYCHEQKTTHPAEAKSRGLTK